MKHKIQYHDYKMLSKNIKTYLEEFLPPVLSDIILSYNKEFSCLPPRLVNLGLGYKKVLPTKDGKLVCSYGVSTHIFQLDGKFIMHIPIPINSNYNMVILEDGNLFVATYDSLIVFSLETGKIITQHSREKICYWLLYTLGDAVITGESDHFCIVDPYKNTLIKLDIKIDHVDRIFNINLGCIFYYVNNFTIVFKDGERKTVNTLGDVNWFITPRNRDTTLYYITKDEAWKLGSYDIITGGRIIIPLNLDFKLHSIIYSIFIGNKLLISTEEVMTLIDLDNNVIIFRRQINIPHTSIELLDYDDYYAILLFHNYNYDLVISKMKLNNGDFSFTDYVEYNYIGDINGEYLFHNGTTVTVFS